MSRPETIDDIELDPIEFATVDVAAIATDGAFVKAYGAFMEACQKAGATVTVKYSTSARFARDPSQDEQESQLRTKQDSWDEKKRQYDLYASVGTLEHSYMASSLEQWARDEGLPYPPPFEPITSFDAVIRDIDEVTA